MRGEPEFVIPQLCALPLQRARELWRMYMCAFAEQLLKWQGNAQSPAALRLVSLQAAMHGALRSPHKLLLCTLLIT